MDGIPEYIKEKIDINWGTLRAHSSQGFMSEVYRVDGYDGARYIFHKIKLLEEHKKGMLPEKLEILRGFFANEGETKTPRYTFIEAKDGFLFTLQRYIDGIPSGKRVLENNTIIDIFGVMKEEDYISRLLEFLAELHEKRTIGAGYIEKMELGILHGNYSSWRSYILYNLEPWIVNSHLHQEDAAMVRKIVGMISETSKNSLIHGDVFNPSNILIDANEDIIGVIDWEWSIIGDAAWEFAPLGGKKILESPVMNIYFKNRNFGGEEQNIFIEKVKRYHIIWLLWGTHLHVDDTEEKLYRSLREYLIDSIHNL